MLCADYIPYTLQFKEQARTSRSVMHTHRVWYIRVWDESNPEVFGIGECAPLEGLSPECNQYYEKILARACQTINNIDVKILQGWSSIRFGVETALADLKHGGIRRIFDTPWSDGVGSITINGLVWMGSEDEMLARINDKLSAGFHCIKLKIGGIDFEGELRLLQHIREAFGPDMLEIRLDANCAFSAYEAIERLERLAAYSIHSIEQPIARRLWADMARLCRESPIPIALDEELIGVSERTRQCRLLDEIRPAYIILKPTLCGGLTGARQWVELASERGIGWWLTSALESNIGLNAIAQLAADLKVSMPQGLGTGALYTNNIPSPLTLCGDELSYNIHSHWDLKPIIS